MRIRYEWTEYADSPSATNWSYLRARLAPLFLFGGFGLGAGINYLLKQYFEDCMFLTSISYIISFSVFLFIILYCGQKEHDCLLADLAAKKRGINFSKDERKRIIKKLKGIEKTNLSEKYHHMPLYDSQKRLVVRFVLVCLAVLCL